MRVFYIFKINKEFATLTRNAPYNLFKALEQIYYLDSNDFDIAYKTFETLAIPFDKRKINIELFEKYRHNQNYTKFNNCHMINNYYTDEQSELTVRRAHLILKSSINMPSFLKDLTISNDLFVCDFQNKDYFWLEELQTTKI